MNRKIKSDACTFEKLIVLHICVSVQDTLTLCMLSCFGQDNNITDFLNNCLQSHEIAHVLISKWMWPWCDHDVTMAAHIY